MIKIKRAREKIRKWKEKKNYSFVCVCVCVCIHLCLYEKNNLSINNKDNKREEKRVKKWDGKKQ